MGWLSDTWESVKENASDICHGVLDVAGFIPVLGAVPDLLNAGIYALEGNALDAGMSLVAAVPGVGDIGAAVGKGGKYLFKGGKWLLGKGKKLFKGGGKLLKALKKSKFLGKLGNLLGKMKVGAKALFNKGKEKGKALFDKIASKFKRGCKNGNGCFVENTLVWTEEGLKNIQEIKKGELIYSKDEKKGKVGLKQVKRVFESKVHTIYTIQIGDTEEVQTTNYHPFYVKEKGWVCAIQLQVGDELCTIEGDVKKVSSIKKERWEEGIFVYNFEVEDWESYFVSGLGVYIHNGKCSKNVSKPVKPEAAVTGSKKHGVNWKEGKARAVKEGKPQGQWAKEDLDYATEKANTLGPREAAEFELPKGSKSVVHMPDGTTIPAKKFWIRNNGTGTWHGYPKL